MSRFNTAVLVPSAFGRRWQRGRPNLPDEPLCGYLSGVHYVLVKGGNSARAEFPSGGRSPQSDNLFDIQARPIRVKQK